MTKRLAIYVRTSTATQDTGLEAQLMACKDYCARIGVTDYIVFSDDDEHGNVEHRPELDRMRAAVEAGEIDRILVYCLSRLTRDLIQSQLLAADFKSKGVTLLSCSETLDFDTPEGRLLYAILGAVNQYQREDIVRKVKNGLENAKRKGVKLGRKLERDDGAILELVDRNIAQVEIARRLGVSRSAVQRAIKARGK